MIVTDGYDGERLEKKCVTIIHSQKYPFQVVQRSYPENGGIHLHDFNCGLKSLPIEKW